MSKSKKKLARRERKNRVDKGGSQCGSSDDESVETMSVLSAGSSNRRGSQDNDLAPEDDQLSPHFWEDRVSGYIEEVAGTKSSPRRNAALLSLCRSIANNYSPEFLADKPATMTEIVERGLKRGKPEEQIISADMAAVLVLQYGSSPEGAEVQRAVSKIFITQLKNDSISAKVRERMAAALAITTFIAEEEIHDAWEAMEQLSAVFSRSCGALGEVKMPVVPAAESKVHLTALLSWGLLLSVAEERAYDLIDRNLATVTALLHSADVEVRVAAGEVLALMYEIARDEDSDFEGDDLEKLCEELHTLATDSARHRAKRDRRMQRASFRQVEHAVRDGSKIKVKVEFGSEMMILTTWEEKRIYDAVCGFLGSGMNHHLRFNPVVRDLFGLGSPRLATERCCAGSNRIPPTNAELKMRTKQLAKCRDKRMDFI